MDEIPLPAEPSDDPYIRRLQVEREREQLRAELENLQATNAELQAVLADLQHQVEAQTAALQQAQAALAAATEAAKQAAEAERAKAREVRELERRMRQMAVDAYVSPPADDRLSVILQGGDLNELSTAMVYFDAKFGHDVDLVAELKRARLELADRRRAAEEAQTQAAGHSDEVAAALTQLQATQASQQELANVLQQRMGEVDQQDAALENEHGDLDARIAERREELLSIATRLSGNGDVPLVTVGGIQIHQALAGPLAAMLAAARADGIELGGGGYRSFEAQVATRRANCGGDDYAIWEMPASACSPPTAKPGTSMHELGLAVDFTYNGSVIPSHDSPAFQWLAEHAAFYGFFNLPSEPWHWSANGN
jgi:LAS superfamily LD-carboxypeptidase LdcB